MTIQDLQQKLAETKARATALMGRAQQQAASEGRSMSETEKAGIQAVLDEAKQIKLRLDRAQGDANMTAEIDRLTAGMTDRPARGGGDDPRSLGAQLIDSDMFKWLQQHKQALPSGAWTSPSSELMATTLDTSSGSAGALVTPHYLPGVLPLPTRPLVVADLIASGTADSNLITFMKETAFTNAAAAVAEAGIKPESTIVFAASSETVRKLAHWIPVTDEALDDIAQFRSYIDTRLRLGVQLTEDDQLLNGTGIAPNLNGLLVRAGLATAVARGTDTNADAILKQISAIATATGLAPDGIVMNPTNWQSIQLLKAADGTYLGGSGPFTAPRQPTLWGLPVALTSAIVVNTALVGAFQTAAQLFRRGGIRVEASNSHASFFVENKIAIRAEERLALVCYRESAVGKVTGLL